MSGPTVCPYCRMEFTDDGPAKIYCTACGMPHHEDCYMENGGCTVFGCPRAPADDPKLQVSQQELGSVMMTPQTATPTFGQYGHYAQYQQQRAPYPVGIAKSRTTFVVLGVFLGMFGAHNFYAGYTGKAVGQLCLSILTLGYLLVVSWIWAIIEICVVEKDSAGLQFS